MILISVPQGTFPSLPGMAWLLDSTLIPTVILPALELLPLRTGSLNQARKTGDSLKTGTFSPSFFLKKLFIYLFMAVLGLCFCVRAFSSGGKRGPLFFAVCGPLTIAASLVAEHTLQTRRLSNCGSWAQLFHGMWDLPRPGLEPVSPELAGRFSTTAPPGKPLSSFLSLA